MKQTHHFSIEPDDEYMRRTYGCTKAEYKALRNPKSMNTTDKAVTDSRAVALELECRKNYLEVIISESGLKAKSKDLQELYEIKCQLANIWKA